MSNKFHHRLIDIQSKRNYSIVRLAKKLNVSKSTVKAWRSGDLQPNAQQVEHIAELLKVKPSALFYDEVPSSMLSALFGKVRYLLANGA
ncbi:helix-turn-helix transcriptional regulator [Vibrio parahaemolyticus]|uniref:helix-turn-helix transcriptional regulator n=1 Tax=Vibrio parahaemolyticus TaxID=670 RepID=UPI00226B3C3E|nr:helix-turn-helix domain-containing protein [Vibrio parahaemolyticus]MCX8941288.1 helix-turn-helix domain-containing protein [Vibrio parahaemolyticus]